MKTKNLLLVASVGLAVFGLSAFIWWRITEATSAPPPKQVAVVVDASNSMHSDCAADESIARRAMDLSGVGRGSTFTIIRTGDDTTRMEPQLVFQEAIPGPLNTGPFGGQRHARVAREAFVARAKDACLGVKPTKQSPIVKAVRRGLVHLTSLGCKRESGCMLIVQSDLNDNDEAAPTRRGAKAPAVLDNTGIHVVLCGFSGTVDDGSAANTDAMLATWKGLFVEPVKFAPFCGSAIIAEVQTNTQRRLMGLTIAAHDQLSTPLQAFSPTDVWTLGDAFEGTAIFGSPGSGKSSTSGKALAYAFLKTPMMGGLILTAKAEETRNWIAYAKDCGREKDLVIFNVESGHCLDPLHYEFHRGGRGAGDQESIIDFFTTMLSIGKQMTGTSADAYWERANEKLIRHVLILLSLSGEPISITSMNLMIESLPSRPGECEEEAWQQESYCATVIHSITERKDTLTDSQWKDLDIATRFVFKRWPSMDERPRSSIEMT